MEYFQKNKQQIHKILLKMGCVTYTTIESSWRMQQEDAVTFRPNACYFVQYVCRILVRKSVTSSHCLIICSDLQIEKSRDFSQTIQTIQTLKHTGVHVIHQTCCWKCTRARRSTAEGLCVVIHFQPLGALRADFFYIDWPQPKGRIKCAAHCVY